MEKETENIVPQEQNPAKKAGIKRFVPKVVFFLIGLALMDLFMKYLLVDDDKSYTRVMLHELYNTEDNIDILFLGSSHTYRAFVPEITDKIFGMNTFNAGTSSQQYDGSYALLLEAGKHNDIKTVYLEVCSSHMNSNYKGRTQLTQTYIISDYMRPSLNKIRYLLGASRTEYYLNSFFPSIRLKEYLLQEGYVEDNVSSKMTDGYVNYAYPGNPATSNEYYAGKGYVANKSVITNENWSRKIGAYPPIPDNMMSDYDLRTFKKMADYCDENNIELIFVATPIADFRACAYGNYDYAVEQLEDICKDLGIRYYDFNICKLEYFNYGGEYYKDDSHLNCYGAEAFSEIFSKFFTGQLKEEELFYASYADKMSAMGNRVFGLEYLITSDSENDVKTIELSAVQNADFTVYASISKNISESDETIEIQPLGELASFVEVPSEETGELIINIYEDGQGTIITNEISISY